jgi:hypothetical protein
MNYSKGGSSAVVNRRIPNLIMDPLQPHPSGGEIFPPPLGGEKSNGGGTRLPPLKSVQGDENGIE